MPRASRENRRAMNTLDDEESTVPEKLHASLALAIPFALAKLHRAAQGHAVFKTDRQLHACLALARFTPLLFLPSMSKLNREPKSLAHPGHSPEEAERLLCLLEEAAKQRPNDQTQMTNE
jgi:hypothetical protein